MKDIYASPWSEESLNAAREEVQSSAVKGTAIEESRIGLAMQVKNPPSRIQEKGGENAE